MKITMKLIEISKEINSDINLSNNIDDPVESKQLKLKIIIDKDRKKQIILIII